MVTGKRRVGGPARGAGSGSPKAPDFTVANLAAQRHGANSPRLVDPLADSILTGAIANAPYLDEPRYTPAVRAWARVEAQCALLAQWLDANGMHDVKGRLRPAEAALHRAETRAATLRASLGLTPLSAARLGRDVAAARSILDVWDATDEDDDEQAEDEEGDPT